MTDRKLVHLLLSLVLLALGTSAWPQADQYGQRSASQATTLPRVSALKEVPDVSGLSRVLLIGDSVSIGYTVAVRQALAGKANVHRISENGKNTGYGLSHLAQWLGPRKWDVISFNWGLHDIRLQSGSRRSISPEAYEANLRTLVDMLKKTGAKLIWCSTTPVPLDGLVAVHRNDDVISYNAIALRVMKEKNVHVNDLYTFILPNLATAQRKSNIHFSREGYAMLGEQVASEILNVLQAR